MTKGTHKYAVRFTMPDGYQGLTVRRTRTARDAREELLRTLPEAHILEVFRVTENGARLDTPLRVRESALTPTLNWNSRDGVTYRKEDL